MYSLLNNKGYNGYRKLGNTGYIEKIKVILGIRHLHPLLRVGGSIQSIYSVMNLARNSRKLDYRTTELVC